MNVFFARKKSVFKNLNKSPLSSLPVVRNLPLGIGAVGFVLKRVLVQLNTKNTFVFWTPCLLSFQVAEIFGVFPAK